VFDLMLFQFIKMIHWAYMGWIFLLFSGIYRVAFTIFFQETARIQGLIRRHAVLFSDSLLVVITRNRVIPVFDKNQI